MMLRRQQKRSDENPGTFRSYFALALSIFFITFIDDLQFTGFLHLVPILIAHTVIDVLHLDHW